MKRVYKQLVIVCLGLTILVGWEWMVSAKSCKDNTLKDKLKLSLEVRSEKAKQEDRLRFTLVIQNISNDSLTLCFTSSKKVDFVVSQSGAELWRWSSGRMFAQVMLDQAVDSGKIIRFTEVWNYKGLSGDRLPAGAYDLTGILSSKPALTIQSAIIITPP